MATYYLDPINGLDSNAGTSWALAWKTVQSGATSARTAAGDTIRIAKSPDPVNTGLTATFTSGAYGASSWKNFGTQGVTSSTNANPIVITAAAHGLVTGDYVGINGHSTNTNANGVWPITVITVDTFSIPATGNGVGGASGTIYKLTNQILTLSAPVTSTIANCNTAWTAVTSTVTSLNTASAAKEGSGAAKQTITTPAINTRLAYSLTANADYSAYNQISFWMLNTVAVTAGQYTFNLCSDTAGSTIVHTVAIPAIPSINQWVALTVDTGAGLGSSIQSIALYTGATTGTSNVLTFDNIIACGPSGNASSITLNSLISKNNGEGWYNIRSINGTMVNLDNGVNTNWLNSWGYYGVSETVTLWRRETTKLTMAGALGNSGNSNMGTGFLQKSGTAGNPITYSGGWNTTNTTQDGDSYWDGQNGFGFGFCVSFSSSASYITIDHMSFNRFEDGIGGYNSATNANTWNNLTLTNIANITNCNNQYWGAMNNSSISITNLSFTSSSQFIIGTATNNIINVSRILGSLGDGISFNGPNNTVNIATFIANIGTGNQNGINVGGTPNNNFIYGNIGGSAVPVVGCWTKGFNITAGVVNTLKNFAFSGNVIDLNLNSNQITYIVDCSYAVTPTTNGSVDERAYFRNPNGVTSARCQSDNMTCVTDLVNVHTSGNRSWNITTSRTSAAYPATLNLGYIVIGPGSNTITAWVRRDNAAMSAGIQVQANQIEGMTTAVQALTSAAINTWAQLTLTITTATQSGPVMLQAYGLSSTGTQNMWVADVGVS